MLIWIQDQANGLVVGLISGLLVSLICVAIRKLIWRIQIGISQFSGEWEQQIFDSSNDTYEGNAIKIDTYKIKHQKTKYSRKLVINISGIITRDFPIEQKHRKWDFSGYLDGDVLTILYQSSQEVQKSRGCIYVKLFKDFEFRGYYLEEHKDGKIDKTPVIIRKKGI